MRVWCVFVAVLLLSGCVDQDSGDSGEDAVPDAAAPGAREPFEEPITLRGCTGLEVIMVGDAALVAPYIPADFQVPDRPLVIVGAFLCGADAEVAERAFVALQVVPRDEALLSPTAESYFWEPEHYVANGTPLGALFAKAYANMTLGSAAVRSDVTSTAFDIQAPGVTYRWRGSSADPVGLADQAASALPPFREYAAADGGYAYLDAAFGAGPGEMRFGPGTLTADGDTVGRALFGASSTQVAGFISELAYEDAKVGFVPRPGG